MKRLHTALILSLFAPWAHTAAGVAQQPTLSAETACPAPTPAAASAFPSGNKARRITGKQLQLLLQAESHEAASSSDGSSVAVVVLFFLESCVHSNALAPVFQCLPAFFPPGVEFVMVDYGSLSVMSVMSHGLHALPVLQVNARGRKYRYRGKHQLPQMLRFVSKALGQEPVLSLEAASLCSPGPLGQPSSGAGQPEPAAAAASTAAASTAAAAAGEEGGPAAGDCGGWVCPRWDGEATVEELTGQKHALLFHVSVAFVACRLLWWLVQRQRERRRQGPASATAAGETAAAATVAAQRSDAGTAGSGVGNGEPPT